MAGKTQPQQSTKGVIMIEKVNPMHPDKIADRIAGALVDYAYKEQERPRIAVEVLIGHNKALIIAETSVHIPLEFVHDTVKRVAQADVERIEYVEVPQDAELSKNQSETIRCGDNGIFKGMPLTEEQKAISLIARKIYDKFPTDGKYILDNDAHQFIACQSNADNEDLLKEIDGVAENIVLNPLGYWTGGINVDSGATNRKLGSDMADGVTGGGLHGKDLSKADVSVNIYAFMLAQASGKPVELHCAIGDEEINGVPYENIVKTAGKFIEELGGFEKLAEWGLF